MEKRGLEVLGVCCKKETRKCTVNKGYLTRFVTQIRVNSSDKICHLCVSGAVLLLLQEKETSLEIEIYVIYLHFFIYIILFTLYYLHYNLFKLLLFIYKGKFILCVLTERWKAESYLTSAQNSTYAKVACFGGDYFIPLRFL